ncbi:c-type cytochrome [Thermus thermamylovorans]|uniref:C-type cytochrome n=1 Tax=Thermus thermamylovorans TaxID=2509362 RepID=A0A4Q9AYY1_9DEIN|nr:cytochrome c [Thermus thermamylovorans]TBH17275.1 c-type cytochrome [Thermus thermamylovorans]
MGFERWVWLGVFLLGALGILAARDAGEKDPLLEEGRALYLRACAACHGPGGEGGIGPALRQNPRLGSVAGLREVILGGREPYMPPVGAEFTPRELAAVISYLRAALGPGLSPVSEEEVSGPARP